MKKDVLRFFVYSFLTTMLSLSQIAGYSLADEGKPGEVNQLRNTITSQEEEIKKLQSEIMRLQEDIERLKKENGTVKQDPVAKALHESWGCGYKRPIQVSDGVLKITFSDINDIITFFDTGAEEHARSDLSVFLKTEGLANGTVEYYSASKKLFEINGNATSAQTRKFY